MGCNLPQTSEFAETFLLFEFFCTLWDVETP